MRQTSSYLEFHAVYAGKVLVLDTVGLSHRDANTHKRALQHLRISHGLLLSLRFRLRKLWKCLTTKKQLAMAYVVDAQNRAVSGNFPQKGYAEGETTITS